MPDALEDEDMLEMLNAGLLQAVVVDDWKAKMWAQVLPQGQGPRRHRAAAEDEDRLGDPQEQPEARGRAERVLRELRQEAGVHSVSLQQQYMKTIKALQEPDGARTDEALPGD